MADQPIVTDATLKATLSEKLEATHVEIQDMSGGCGQAFVAWIVSARFAQKTTLARHRLVNAALKREIAAIHAWTPKCYTPEEWAVVARERESKAQGSAEPPGEAVVGDDGLEEVG